MKMGIQRLLFCLVLCLAVGRISGKVLETFDDLIEQTDFGKQNPRQGLELLCWLLNQSKMDQNGNLLLNFNPTEQCFGFHQYKNFDRVLLPDLSNTNFLYYTLGNFYYRKAKKELPSYFNEILQNSQKHPQSNSDRIVIRIRKDNPRLVDEVYITPHYDENLTFKISKQLLEIIAKLCKPEDDDRDQEPDQNDPGYERFKKIKDMFSNAPYLHLFLYRVGYNPDMNVQASKTSNSPAKSNVLVLKLGPTPDGSAKVELDWIPKELMEQEMKICIYQNKYATKPLFEFPLDAVWGEETETDLPFNADLELRIEPITNSKQVQLADKWFSPSYLLSLVFYPFSSLFSLVVYICSSLYSLVFGIINTLFSLIVYICSSLYSLVFGIISTLFSLIVYIFSSLYSLVFGIISTLSSLVVYILNSLYSLVFGIISTLFSLVCYLISSLCSLVMSIIIILVTGAVNYALTQSRAEPNFIRVSHGRPGF